MFRSELVFSTIMIMHVGGLRALGIAPAGVGTRGG